MSSAARRRMSLSALVALALLEIARAGAPAAAPAARASPTGGPDPHSYANFDEMRVRHLDLALEVDIESKRLSGAADLTVERLAPAARMLRLDTRDLLVRAAWLVQEDDRLEALEFALGTHDPVLGRELRIELPADAPSPATVRISYQTRPQATGLQWLPPAQTADRSSPFLFSQSQAIHARSWIPLQDSPAVRQTYRATIHAPEGFRALMSGAHAVAMPPDGVFRFDMRQPIPSYLIAIAVGRLEFRAMSERTGVYAEPSVVEAAAREFADTERMLVESEKLFGPYRWERYDLLILPPSFPFGGMENPRLSFITPSVIAGDRSLTGLIAHELAHSWSGNLVTNASWKDLWLNEGFTTFLEARIVEAVYGPRRNAMEKVLGLQALRRDMADLEPRDTRLELVLAGRDPDDAFSEVPYQKGALFLDWLESRVGREAMDAFLKAYFERFAFRSIDTEGFRAYLREELLARHPGRVSEAELDAWIEGPGLPKFAVLPESDAFAKVDRARADFLAGRIGTRELPAAEWTTHEWLHFLDNLPAKLARERLTALDEAFSLTESANSEIAHSWYRIAIRNGYEPAWDELEVYLVRIGRRKLIKPLYEDLMKAPGGAALARRIYARARSGYHPIAVATLDDIVR